MSIQNAFSRASQSFTSYCEESKQVGLSVMEKWKEFRANPEFFQKVCQVAFSALQLTFLRHQHLAPSLSKLSFTLQTANMHDFYSFLKLPRQWFAPITVDTINQASLEKALADKIYGKPISRSSYRNKRRAQEACNVARACLKAQLEQMAKDQEAYRNFEQFKVALEHRLRAIQTPGYKYKFSTVRLDSLFEDPAAAKQFIRPSTPIESLANSIWTVVDLCVIGLYSKGWKLLDTAKWAQRIGNYPALTWVKHHHLERWVLGLVTGGFALKGLESARKLAFEDLTREQALVERWNVVTSLAEATLWGATYLNLRGQISVPSSYLHAFALFTKSLGLLSIVCRPKQTFFQVPWEAQLQD